MCELGVRRGIAPAGLDIPWNGVRPLWAWCYAASSCPITQRNALLFVPFGHSSFLVSSLLASSNAGTNLARCFPLTIGLGFTRQVRCLLYVVILEQRLGCSYLAGLVLWCIELPHNDPLQLLPKRLGCLALWLGSCVAYPGNHSYVCFKD